MALDVTIKKKLHQFTLDVSFSTDNKTTGMLGPSGCGKSMTLKCIAGLEQPDEGFIILNGRVLFDSKKGINLPPQERGVGYLFQHYALFPHMNIEENICCAMKGSKSEKKEELVRILSRFDLLSVKALFPAQLSGGQQQRVALARIMASSPEILLLDEPFSALDRSLKDLVMTETIDYLNSYQSEFVIVSHDRDDLFHVCKNLLVMNKGRSLLCDATLKVLKNPRYEEVAKLVGYDNIAAAAKITDNLVHIPSWGCKLKVKEPLPNNFSAVAIHSSAFYPADAEQVALAENSFEIEVVRQIHKWQNSTIFFHIISSQGTSDKSLQWQLYDAGHRKVMPQYLTVDPEHVVLLEK